MVLVAVGLAVYDAYEFLGPDRGPQYYRRAPYLLLIPVGLAAAAGVVIRLWPRLRGEMRHRLALAAWTLGNVAGSIVAAVLGYKVAAWLWGLCRRVSGPSLWSSLDLSVIFCGLGEVGLVLFLIASWRALARAVRTGVIIPGAVCPAGPRPNPFPGRRAPART
jgi:hypothetical protein